MCISSITYAPPCFSGSEKVQSIYSLFVRIAAVVTGAIALTVGVLVLHGVINGVGIVPAWSLVGIGSLLILAGICLKSVEQSVSQEFLPHTADQSEITVVDHEMTDAVSNPTQPTNTPIDFAKITPANFEEFIVVTKNFNSATAQKGDVVFTKSVKTEGFSSPMFAMAYKKGDVYLDGVVACPNGSCYYGVDIFVRDGKFIHYPQMNAPAEHFSNLKDYFDYLFQGKFYQGEYLKGLDFISLKGIDGREIKYDNPFKVNAAEVSA